MCNACFLNGVNHGETAKIATAPDLEDENARLKAINADLLGILRSMTNYVETCGYGGTNEGAAKRHAKRARAAIARATNG